MADNVSVVFVDASNRQTSSLDGVLPPGAVKSGQSSGSPWYGRLTQLSPLSLAQRDTPWVRFRAWFSRRAVAHVSYGDILLAIGYIVLHCIVSGVLLPKTLTQVALLFGLFAATNATVVALPATRNSL